MSGAWWVFSWKAVSWNQGQVVELQTWPVEGNQNTMVEAGQVCQATAGRSITQVHVSAWSHTVRPAFSTIRPNPDRYLDSIM